MNIKKYNHYVPKFYLAKFSKNPKYIDKCIIKTEKIIRKASTKGTGGQDYLYGRNSAIEDELANYEGAWNEVITEIIQHGILSTDPKPQLLLRYFIVLSYARTLDKAENTKEMWERSLEMAKKLEEGTTSQSVSNEIRNQTEAIAEIPNYSAFQQVDELVRCCSDLKMMLIINESTIPFITCDHPVVMYNQFFAANKYQSPYWPEHVGIQFFLPISPTYCLTLFDPKPYRIRNYKDNIFHLKDHMDVNAINELIAGYARSELYFSANTEDEYIRRLLKKRKAMPLSPSSVIFKRGNCRFLVEAEPSIYKNIQIRMFKVKKAYSNVTIKSDDGPYRDLPKADLNAQLQNPPFIYLGKSSDPDLE